MNTCIRICADRDIVSRMKLKTECSIGNYENVYRVEMGLENLISTFLWYKENKKC
jgi:hypothetical protein